MQKNQLKEADERIEENEKHRQKELSDLNRNTENTILQLKSLFEAEKIRLEDKIKDERENIKNKYILMIEEQTNRNKAEVDTLRDENDTLENNLKDLEELYENYVSKSEHDIQFHTQKNESLEKTLKESRENFTNFQNQANQTLEQTIEGHNRERKELVNKIENLLDENHGKEKELSSVTLKREQLEKMLQDKELFLNKKFKEYEDDKKELWNKLDHYKTK